ncbi:MAG TPA: TolC family protein [Gemmatimonadota bacterium]|nr:TolC family protein [Gemmatimonadota bacterium]
MSGATATRPVAPGRARGSGGRRPAIRSGLAVLSGIALLGAGTAGLRAQDTLRLAELRTAADGHDPRSEQVELRRRASGLELRNLSSGYLPQLSLSGRATYQSDVPTVPFTLPGGGGVDVPKDQYRADLEVTQLVWDGGEIAARRSLERARLAESQAALRAELYGIRGQVDDAFFRALLLQQRIAEAGRLLDELGRRLEEVRSRVGAGAGLPGDTAAMLAEILEAREHRDALAADRRAALGVLARLAGREVGPDDVLALPDLAARVARARADERVPRRRPEFDLLARQRDALDRQERLAGTERLPKLVAFGTAGYGRPGLNVLGDRFDTYWMAGLRFEWAPWHWGSISREQEALDLRRQIVSTEEETLSRRLQRAVQEPLETIDRLGAALASDRRIIDLRSELERQAESQLHEQVITPARYIEVLTDLHDARDAWQTHRVELAWARAAYLTTLGYEPTEEGHPTARRTP